eukprot:COSAG01_NODE_2535_length_7489_cov_14.116644_1_plen_126_part_00
MPKFTELQDLPITIVIGVLKRARRPLFSPKPISSAQRSARRGPGAGAGGPRQAGPPAPGCQLMHQQARLGQPLVPLRSSALLQQSNEQKAEQLRQQRALFCAAGALAFVVAWAVVSYWTGWAATT